MERFHWLPKVSEGVYERVKVEREGMDGWDAPVIVNTIEGGLELLGGWNPLLVRGVGDVLRGVKKVKERRAFLFELYFLLRLINNARAEGG